MEPSSHIVDVLSKQKYTCRNLETGIWNDYLENTISYGSDGMLAYHLKENEDAPDFACLIRVNYSKAKKITIFIYCICVILLGMIGSLLATAISEQFCNYAYAELIATILAGLSIVGIVVLSNA
jgi:hypothetical protein